MNQKAGGGGEQKKGNAMSGSSRSWGRWDAAGDNQALVLRGKGVLRCATALPPRCARKPLGEEARQRGWLGSAPRLCRVTGDSAWRRGSQTHCGRTVPGRKKNAQGLAVGGQGWAPVEGGAQPRLPKPPPSWGQTHQGGRALTSLLVLALAKRRGQVWAAAPEDEEAQAGRRFGSSA